MQSPDVSRLEVLGPVGAGACGRVFRALDADGREVAVKVFQTTAVNAALQEEAQHRLEESAWPAGVLPVLSAEWRGRQWLRVSPFLGWVGDDGEIIPRSLQQRLDRFPGEDSWPVVRGMLSALARLHDRRVAHGNLKPGNVFLDDSGEVVLTDWALGIMPGATVGEYTDAILYQPPEQLRDPDGYLREKGYRWDVFAFGVLAFRLVTGAFPRCTAIFDNVAPEPGKFRREGISANLRSIAKMIEEAPKVVWPDAPANELEGEYRKVLERCLSLEPAARPANAAEVLAAFERAEEAASAEKTREMLLDRHRRARRSLWRSHVATGLLVAGVLGLAVMWQMEARVRQNQERMGGERTAEKDRTLTMAKHARDEAVETLSRERKNLQYEKDLWLSRLEASRATGDHLFAWAMEKGHRQLPPLDGRETRLNRLERYFEEFITRTADSEALKEERARARLQLAEVSLARGDAATATTRLEEAMTSAADLPAGPDLDLRLATDRLLLALLLQERQSDEAVPAFRQARQALEAVPQAKADADRVQQLLAVLDFHESKLLAAAGQDNDALSQLHRATQTLARLSDQRPDVPVLRSELAACFLDSATILDGIGEMGSAREVRAQAAEELQELLTKDPGNRDLKFELAGCYGGMAEAAVLAGDVATGISMSSAATKLLEELVTQWPDRAEVRSMLAAQYGMLAGIVRDRGDAEGALKRLDAGIRLVEAIAIGESANALARYRLALLQWQKGRILGSEGDRKAEIDLHTRAADALRRLLDADDYGLLRPEQIRRSLGYLLGDLGHAAQLDRSAELARSAFTEAVSIWSTLNRSRPGNEEYLEGLEWCRQRLAELES